MTIAFLAGILLLYFGSEALVKGGSSLALRLNIQPLIIGLTVIAISTSSPELTVSVQAAWTSHGDILVGDIVGSNIFNIAGILCFCAIFRNLPIKKQAIKLDWPVMFLAYLLLTVFLLDGRIPRWGGFIFLVLVVLYLFALFFVTKRKIFHESEIPEVTEQPLKNVYLDIFLIVGGWAVLIYGGHLVVASAILFAQYFGLSEATVGLSVVAIGTSLPEMSCSFVAMLRKKHDILVGNIIGSNIFNVFFVTGLSAMIRPIEMTNIRYLDIGMMFLTGMLVFPFFQKKLLISRIWALILFLCYLSYVFLLYF